MSDERLALSAGRAFDAYYFDLFGPLQLAADAMLGRILMIFWVPR
jgi:hypothetical protein